MMPLALTRKARASLAAVIALIALSLPGAALSQVAFRGAASAFNQGMGVQHSALGTAVAGTGATVTPGLPARVAGDLLLAIIEAKDLNAIAMPSPNWTLLTSGTQSTIHQAAIFWRIATNTAADTATISHAAAPAARQVLFARVVAFSNVDTANPFDGFTLGSSGGTNATVNTGTITTTNECSLLVATVHVSDNNSIPGGGAPPGWFQSFYSTSGTGSDTGIGVWYLGATAAGLQPSVAITHSNIGNNDYSHAAQVALRPGGITLSVPGTTQAGDVMIATLATRPANSNPANQNAKKVCEPPGWTLLRDTTTNTGGGTGGTGARLQTYYRVATASEPASYTWYAQLNNPSVPPATVFISGVGGIVSYSGVDTTTPIDVHGGNTTGNSFSHTGNSITTTVAETMLVASHTFISADTWTPPAGMSERVDQSAPASPPGNAVGIALEMSDEPRPVAGATGPRTAVANGTGSSNTDEGIVHMLALRRIPAPVTPGDFNAFESSTTPNPGAITGRIFTKLAGTAFSLDVVAILSGAQFATFTNTVLVDLVTGSTGGLNCPGTPVAIAGTSQNVNLTSGRGTTAAFNVASAFPDARVRVRYPVASPTVTSCSTDNFAIRPLLFTVTSTNATQTGSSGAPTIKTGANFNLTAASVAGYNGIPVIDNTKVTGTPTAGTIGGSFGAAPAGTGIATGSSFFYSEVGNFGFNADAVRDTAFTSVDQAAGDCIASSTSNTLSGGKYGCWVGSGAVAQTTGSSGFGRFIPDNFNVANTAPPIFGTGCGTFTYVGAKFTYPTAVMTVTARSGTANGLTNTTTVNYAGAYAKLTNAVLNQAPYDTKAGRYTRFDAGATPALDHSGLPDTATDPTISAFANGVGTLTFSSGTGLSFARSTTTPSAPFNADIALALNVIDTDGVVFAGNPATFGAATSGNGIAFSGGNPMRFGRINIGSASGSATLPLPVPIEAQYWNGKSFVTNTLDNCTSISASGLGSDVEMGNYTGALAPSPNCKTAISNGGALVSGRRSVRLSAPTGNVSGNVTLTVNLGAASGKTCTSTGVLPGDATTANRPYLQSGSGFGQNPSGRASFGLYKGSEDQIHRQENF